MAKWIRILPYVSSAAGLLGMSFAYIGLGVDGLVAERATIVGADSVPTAIEARATSPSAATIRWAGWWWGLVVAWVCLGTVAVGVTARLRRERGRADPFMRWLGVVTLVLVAIGLALEWTGIRPGVSAEGTPRFAQVRNVLGWLSAGALLFAQAHVLQSVLDARTSTDLDERARRVAAGLRDVRMLVIGCGLALAVGVAQVSAQVRLQVVQALRDRSAAASESIGDELVVSLGPALLDLEDALTLATGIGFASMILFAFLPTVLLLERERLEVLRLPGVVRWTGEAAGRSPSRDERWGASPLERSTWGVAAEAAGFLLPLLSGFLVTSL